MKTELYLATRYFFRGKAKHISFISIISCLGVMLGVATLIIVISVMNGFDKDLMERLLRFNYHLTIEALNESDLISIKQEISKWPQVKSCSLFLQTQIFGKFGNLVIPIVVRGIDFDNKEEKRVLSQYIKEEREDKEGFFIGEGLKKRFYIEDKIEFYPLSKKLQLKEEKIKGVFSVGLYDIDNNYILTDLEKAKTLSKNYLIFLGMRIKNPFKVKIIKEKISKSFPQGIIVHTWTESNKALFSALKLEKITMFIILTLIIVVASFNIFATLTVKVVEKTKDIGILKSLGFTSKRILTIFVIQGLLIGAIGVSIGSVLGVGVCLFLKKYPFIKLPEEIYYIEYLPVSIRPCDIILIVFVGLLLSFIFSILPALRAARLSCTEALRYE
jgi:lipoprotein-releasing system permease protein